MIDVYGRAPSTSRKFGTDLGIIVNPSEIIFGSCEFLPLSPTTYQRLSPVSISRDLGVSFPCTDTDWKAIGPQYPAWRNLAGLGAIGRVVVEGVISG